MGMVKSIFNFFGSKTTREIKEVSAQAEAMGLKINIALLQVDATINLIANTIAKAEFNTFIKGQKIKGNEWMLWNYSANQNQSANAFMSKVVNKLLRTNECLIIEVNKQLYVADSFTRQSFAFKGNIYSNIMIENFTMSKTFLERNVIYLKYNNENIHSYISSLIAGYNEVIADLETKSRSKGGTKGIVYTESIPSNKEDWNKMLDELYNRRFKDFIQKGNSIVAMPKGMKYENMESAYSSGPITDIVKLTDEIMMKVAQGYHVPVALIKGSVSNIDDIINEFVTFAILPICDVIETEVNRKRYNLKELAAGSRIAINTNNIRHFDVLNNAEKIDKLVASGVFSINAILEKLNEPLISEEWADKHYLTKNYADINDTALLKGGEES